MQELKEITASGAPTAHQKQFGGKKFNGVIAQLPFKTELHKNVNVITILNETCISKSF